MRFLRIGLILGVTAVPALADIVSWEATSFPDESGWQHSTFCTPDRWLQDGWLYQHVEPTECASPPSGDRDSYTRSIAEFDGAPTFFIQWRCMVDGNNSEFDWGAPVVLSAGTLGPANYWFAIASDQVKFTRDIDLAVIMFIDIEPGVPHTFRLELYGSEPYFLYIDSELVHTALPGGPYPAHTPSITWRAKSAYLESEASWDYLRYGTIPAEHSGDYDSNGSVDQVDLYFFCDCLLGPDYDAAGPGCVWADLNSDGSADGRDISQFAAAMIGG